MFIIDRHIYYGNVFLKCNSCLVFWLENIEVPEEICARHAVVKYENAKNGYCVFFRENEITYYPPVEEEEMVNGAYIVKTAKIGNTAVSCPVHASAVKSRWG